MGFGGGFKVPLVEPRANGTCAHGPAGRPCPRVAHHPVRTWAQAEKFTSWDDPYTGVNPFLPTREHIPRSIMGKAGVCLSGACMAVVKTPLVVVIGALYLLGAALCSVVRSLPLRLALRRHWRAFSAACGAILTVRATTRPCDPAGPAAFLAGTAAASHHLPARTPPPPRPGLRPRERRVRQSP